jgi:hypothetical protein
MASACNNPLALANDVRPQSNVGTCDVPPKNIEPLMPVVELRIIGALETCAPESERLHKVAGIGLGHAVAHMRRVRDATLDPLLPPDRPLAPYGRHSTLPASRRRPRTLGKSSNNGE